MQSRTGQPTTRKANTQGRGRRRVAKAKNVVSPSPNLFPAARRLSRPWVNSPYDRQISTESFRPWLGECTSQFLVGMAFWFGIDLISTVSSCEGEMFFEARALPSLRLDPPGGRVFLLPSNFCRHQMPKRRVILCCRTCVVIHARGDSNFAVFDVPTLPLAGGSSLSEGRVLPCALRGFRPALRQKMCQLQTARCTRTDSPTTAPG